METPTRPPLLIQVRYGAIFAQMTYAATVCPAAVYPYPVLHPVGVAPSVFGLGVLSRIVLPGAVLPSVLPAPPPRATSPG